MIKKKVYMLMTALTLVLTASFSFLGVSSVAAQSSQTVTPGDDDTYYVRKGDTLSQIAVEFGVPMASILADNPKVSNPNIIYVNESLLIPEQSNASGVDVDVAWVQQGDTLDKIAAAFGTSVDAILADNPNTQSGQITSGQELLVPRTESSEQNGDADVYIVQPGDTLDSIATSQNTTLDALLSDNPSILNPNIIYTGMEILIPDGDESSSVPSQPILQMTPLSGPEGTTVSVEGSGFPVNTTIDLGFSNDGQAQTYLMNVQTDTNGTFSTEITLTDKTVMKGDVQTLVAWQPGMDLSVSTPNFSVTAAISQSKYVVEPGDNLSLIAQEFGLSLSKLLALNPDIHNPNLIYVNQVINLK
jgi:LysM repeat protein